MTDKTARAAVDDVIFAFGLGVAELRSQVASAEAELQATRVDRGAVQFQLDQLREEKNRLETYKWKPLEAEVERLKKEKHAMQDVIAKASADLAELIKFGVLTRMAQPYSDHPDFNPKWGSE